MQITVTCGEKKPKNIFSYLAPTLKDLLTLQIKGMSVKSSNGETFFFKAFVLAIIGDFPAIAELALHKTHASFFGCRICTVKGKKSTGRRGYSFIGNDEETEGRLRTKRDFDVNVVYYSNIINV